LNRNKGREFREAEGIASDFKLQVSRALEIFFIVYFDIR
jgi:hypothetical protein